MEKFNKSTTSAESSRAERRYENLRKILSEVSVRLNKEFKEAAGGGEGEDLLDGDCRLRIEAFARGVNQGPYSAEEIEADKSAVEAKRKSFEIDPENKNVINYYDPQGKKNPEQIREMFWAEKRRSNWHLLEMATPVLLYKFLPKKYKAVKTAQYDDYENGVDNLIVTETGEVICTVDDVSAFAGSSRDLAKRKKIIAKARRGGASVKYGISYESGRLSKQALHNIPAFNLRLSSEAIKGLLAEMNFDLDQEPSAKERETVLVIIDDLLRQTADLLESGISGALAHKINNFRAILEEWRAGI